MGAACSVEVPGDTSKPAAWAVQDNTITAHWSFILKEHVQCICEGGRHCSKEDPARQSGPPAPLTGLHCNWVATAVLAMARPWQENVEEFDVIGQFKQHGFGLIINLQEVGEHAECGPGNLPSSGFTYSPEAFMAAGVKVVNMSWRDLGVPTLDRMMDLVQIMHHCTAVEGGRVAVHCHAGLGRTGLAAACYLLYSGEAPSAAAAVAAIRAARPGSVQTPSQVLFVSVFEQYLVFLRSLFRSTPSDASGRFWGAAGGGGTAIPAGAAGTGGSSAGTTGRSGLAGVGGEAAARAGRALARALSRTVRPGPSSSRRTTGESSTGSVGGSAAAVALRAPSFESSSSPNVGTGAVVAAAASGVGEGSQAANDARPISPACGLTSLEGVRSAAANTASGTPDLSTCCSSLSVASSLTSDQQVVPLGSCAAAAAPPGTLQSATAEAAFSQQQPLPRLTVNVCGNGGSSGGEPQNPAAAGSGLPGGGQLGAISEEGPLQVISTDMGVTEMYGDGLTIIRAAPPSLRYTDAGCFAASDAAAVAAEADGGEEDTGGAEGGAARLPWTEKGVVRLERPPASGWVLEPPGSYLEALQRQRRLLHGVERRRCARLHRLVRAAVQALAAAVPAYEATVAAERAERAAAVAAAAAQHGSESIAAAAAGRLQGIAGSGGGGPGGALSLGGLGQMLQRRISTRERVGAATTTGSAASTAAAGSAGAVTPPGVATPPRSGGAPLAAGRPLTDIRQLSQPNSAPSSARRRTTTSRDSPGLATTVTAVGPPTFAGAMLAALQARGHVPENKRGLWGALRCVAAFGLSDDGHATAEALAQLKQQVNRGDFSGIARARPAHVLLLLDSWFASFKTEALSEATLELLVDEAAELLQQETELRQVTGGDTEETSQSSDAESSSSREGSSSDESDGAGSSSESEQPSDEKEIRQKAKEKAEKGRDKAGPMSGAKRLARRAVGSAGSGGGGGGGRHGNGGAGGSGGGGGAAAGISTSGGLGFSLAAHLRADAARRTRTMCHALQAHEQDLFLAFAALLRLVRTAAASAPAGDDSLFAMAVGGSGGSAASSAAASRRSTADRPMLALSAGAASEAAGAAAAAGGKAGRAATAGRAAAEREKVMRALCDAAGAWMVHPLGAICPAAREATSTFLWFLVAEDSGYKVLLHAKQQEGLRLAHGQVAAVQRSPRATLARGSSIVGGDSPGSPRQSIMPHIGGSAATGRAASGAGGGLSGAGAAGGVKARAAGAKTAAEEGSKGSLALAAQGRGGSATAAAAVAGAHKQQLGSPAGPKRLLSRKGTAGRLSSSAGGRGAAAEEAVPTVVDEGKVGSLRVGRGSRAATDVGPHGSSGSNSHQQGLRSAPLLAPPARVRRGQVAAALEEGDSSPSSPLGHHQASAHNADADILAVVAEAVAVVGAVPRRPSSSGGAARVLSARPGAARRSSLSGTGGPGGTRGGLRRMSKAGGHHRSSQQSGAAAVAAASPSAAGIIVEHPAAVPSVIAAWGEPLPSPAPAPAAAGGAGFGSNSSLNCSGVGHPTTAMASSIHAEATVLSVSAMHCGNGASSLQLPNSLP